MIRPEAARWFEILVARDDAFAVLEALAGTGAVEIEWHRGQAGADAGARIAKLLRDHAVLGRRYRAYWPDPRLRGRAAVAPADALETAIAAIRAWAAEADPAIGRAQAAELELAQLDAVARVVERLRGAPIDLSEIGRPGGRLQATVFAYPQGARVASPSRVLVAAVDVEATRYVLAVGTPDATAPLAQEVNAAGGRQVRVPAWLRPSAEENRVLIAARRAEAARRDAEARAELDALAARHALALLLGDVVRANWCFENVGAVEGGEILSRITGWTADAAAVADAVERCGARALARFPPAPRGARPPLLLRNPWWARPFELFGRLFGMPGEHAADPSALLAVAVPLLFGYMFGDVGQGLVLAGAGILLARRASVLRLLVPAGLSAAVFGLAFGSVFSLETVIAPLWLHPLEHPLTVLAVPLAGGAALLGVGFALSALEARWSGALGDWLAEEAPVIVVYAGILTTLAHAAAGLWIALGGVVACAVGGARRTGRAGAALAALGELAERTMQVLINTLSFARVGAFALAHAGLSSAVVALAEAASRAAGSAAYVAVLVLGNLLILALEGLVVSIQTTRLVLFEFFARFFRAEGREFRPLAPPPVPT